MDIQYYCEAFSRWQEYSQALSSDACFADTYIFEGMGCFSIQVPYLQQRWAGPHKTALLGKAAFLDLDQVLQKHIQSDHATLGLSSRKSIFRPIMAMVNLT